MDLTPRQIVAELDKYIVGQDAAKRPVAVAIRNRWRRQQLPARTAQGRHAEEHHHDRPHRRRQNRDRPPAGPARRGAVPQGRSDQVHRGRLRRPRCRKHDPRPHRSRPSAWSNRSMRHQVVRRRPRNASPNGCSICWCRRRSTTWEPEVDAGTANARRSKEKRRKTRSRRAQRTRDKMRARLEAGELEDRIVELNVEQKAVPVQIFSNLGMENMDVDFQSMFDKIMPKQNAAAANPDQARPASCSSNRKPKPSSIAPAVTEKAVDSVENQRHHLPRRTRQGVRPIVGARPGRVAAGRAARPAAGRRRHDRQHRTARCGPITSCSSPPGRSTCRSRPT